ncbi:MAG TPA: SDR family oxidoreductase [Syntrophorhabdus sp.]|jgi:NAD(P)-dependent dehydrogenase (short-subunit alcohol dehydrogenase family)|nr:MAG: Gluconate 5-dehydrogenase [Syntrophorhabdus sp. PtaB.Bin027]OQB77970.1 MAG: Gluconate 5-dehydrogenase [Deltaproteobacteria bacterium ADurb.Bin135]HNQ45477.1 SDR family oxidoreductase [Syntrophorhabdus sp.]HNS79307.1 SDR family oxidoreductase [Syntrophorhabdus sp.]HPB38597.1 SDR family oxidoreductase [Syntrophorhabdus sp.]
MKHSLDFSLRGKVAIVTGASGDLGFAMAQALGLAGACVVLSSRNRVKLEDARERIGIDKKNILTQEVDVTKPRQVKLLVRKTIESFGRLDVLVTAAGVQMRKPAIDFAPREWERVLKVNLSGTFFCCQEAAKQMVSSGGGRIILISSLTAEIGLPNMAPYVASRGAIRQLTKALAVEWASKGVTVNSIGPGRFRTHMTEELFASEKIRESFISLIPMGRAGIASDLSGLTVFLASDHSKYLTGQSIYVDGGWLASGGNPLG